MSEEYVPSWEDGIDDDELEERKNWSNFPDKFEFRLNKKYELIILEEPRFIKDSPYEDSFAMLVKSVEDKKEYTVWCGLSIRKGLKIVKNDSKNKILKNHLISIVKKEHSKYKTDEGNPVEFFVIKLLN